MNKVCREIWVFYNTHIWPEISSSEIMKINFFAKIKLKSTEGSSHTDYLWAMGYHPDWEISVDTI